MVDWPQGLPAAIHGGHALVKCCRHGRVPLLLVAEHKALQDVLGGPSRDAERGDVLSGETLFSPNWCSESGALI